MFQTVEGNHVPNLTGIQEGYTKKYVNDYWHLAANVSAEHIEKMFCDLCAKVREPAFLLLEHGTNQKEEENLRQSDQDPFHLDVFYLDGLDYKRFEAIYDVYHELLVHDGEICFGYASHNGTDEVYVGAYKIFHIYTDTPEKYEQVLERAGFVLLENMKTVWDTFTADTPGARRCIKKNNIDIYEMVNQLKEQGLYFAEYRSVT